MLTGITLFRLVTAALLPVLVTVGFYQAEKKSRFGKVSNGWNQLIIGVSFGVVPFWQRNLVSRWKVRF